MSLGYQITLIIPLVTAICGIVQVSLAQNGGTMFTLSSSAFKHNQKIPLAYTGQGEDISPELTWQAAPENTKEFAIICDDPDAPSAEAWVHWVIYNISSTINRLPSGISQQKVLSSLNNAAQGLNSWKTIGYRGPTPPPGSGTHHYRFTIYAIDRKLDLNSGLSKKRITSET